MWMEKVCRIRLAAAFFCSGGGITAVPVLPGPEIIASADLVAITDTPQRYFVLEERSLDGRKTLLLSDDF